MQETFTRFANTLEGGTVFELCDNDAPENSHPTTFDESMSIKEIRGILDEAHAAVVALYPGKKRISLIQRQEKMRRDHVRTGRIPGTKLHVFLFLRKPDEVVPHDRYVMVPLSLLGFFHKNFKLANFNEIVEDRGEDAFVLKPAETFEGFQFPVVDARLWIQRYEKSKGLSSKRIAESSPDPRSGVAVKKKKMPGGAATTSFSANSQEEYARLKTRAMDLGLKAIAEPRTRDFMDLVDIENGEEADVDGFDVIPGAHVGVGVRSLCAEDFSAFSQTPQTNYFLSLAAGLHRDRTKKLARSLVQWKDGKSSWSPSTLVSVLLRSDTKMRNFDAIIRSVINESEIASGLGITASISIDDSEKSDGGDDEDDEDDLFSEDGTVKSERLLLKHTATLEKFKDALLQFALEPYCAMLFSRALDE